jgi:hypothetical protein
MLQRVYDDTEKFCTVWIFWHSCSSPYIWASGHAIDGYHPTIVRICLGTWQVLKQTVKGCRGGVTDGAHQALAVTLAALGPPEVNRVRLGPLSLHTVKTLRHILDFLGVHFDIKPDTDSQTILLSCVGAGITSLGRRVQ